MHVAAIFYEQKSCKYLDRHTSCHLTTEPSCLTRPPLGPIYTLPHICFGLNQCQGLHALELIRRAAAHWSCGLREHCDRLSGCDEKCGKVCPYVCVHPICSWFWLGYIHFFLCNGMLQRMYSLQCPLNIGFPQFIVFFMIIIIQNLESHICHMLKLFSVLLLATLYWIPRKC